MQNNEEIKSLEERKKALEIEINQSQTRGKQEISKLQKNVEEMS